MNTPANTPEIAATPPAYAELCVTSNFTFLTGASHPEELVLRAAELGLAAIAVTDRNSLAGVVRAWSALKCLRGEREAALQVRSARQVDSSSRQVIAAQELPHAPLPAPPRLIVGARLVLRDCPVEWLALPTDRAAYNRLSRLLTRGKRRAGKGQCHLDLHDLETGCRGMTLIALPPAHWAIAGLAQAEAPVGGRVAPGAAPRW